jgi:hypothetical protein
MARNARMWAITVAAGKRFNVIENLTKSEAKAAFNRLAEETTRSCLNDTLDLLIISRKGNDIGTMERVGRGEYSFHINGEFTLDGEMAYEMMKAV